MMMNHQARLQMQQQQQQQQQLAMNQQQTSQPGLPMTPQQGQLASQQQQQHAMDMANRSAGMAQAGKKDPKSSEDSLTNCDFIGQPRPMMGMTGPGVPVTQMSGAMQHPNTPFTGDCEFD